MAEIVLVVGGAHTSYGNKSHQERLLLVFRYSQRKKKPLPARPYAAKCLFASDTKHNPQTQEWLRDMGEVAAEALGVRRERDAR